MDGDAASFGIDAASAVPLEDTYCQRMVDGRLPTIVADARSDERVRDFGGADGANLGAYVGVQLRFSNGEVFGTLCCLSHAAKSSLGDHDVRFMQVLAGVIIEQLESNEQEAGSRRLKSEAESLHALLTALDARDAYTAEHSEMVVDLARAVAAQLGLSDREVTEVEQVARLHDIGKLGIPDAVLRKPAPLDAEEQAVMREHPVIGASILASIDGLGHLAPLVRSEHERWDGAGYPDGLAGDEIPLASRIVFACDALHAMTSDRPYRAAMSRTAAIGELERGAGTQFDPLVVETLLPVRESWPAEQPAASFA